ncbi:MAG: hypothetical protein AB1724_00660 [Thermodesulfobacteriota bacterium]
MGGHSVTLIIMATMLEAKPFVSGLGLEAVSEKPFPVFKSNNRVLVISGIGKAHAAAATAFGCVLFKPSRVINAGAAGALETGYPVGAMVQIRHIVEHDRPDIFTGRPVSHQPDMVAGGLAAAVLATGDRPVIQPADRKALSVLAGLVDMEAAAVVQTCRTLAVPCHIFKFVSDEPGHTNGLDIINNIRAFRTPFFEFINTFVLEHPV